MGATLLAAGLQQHFSIAAMPTGLCWLDPRLIGSSPEEALAIGRNEVAADRLAHLQGMTQIAVERLRDVHVLNTLGYFARLS
jgi:hypothetical protein